MKAKDGREILFFEDDKSFEKWLSKNHSTTDGVWLQFYKKGSGVKTLTYDPALDVALCYGWIDGIANKLDEKSYLQKFTPRREKSIWSKRNTEHIARLTKEGRMHKRGLDEVEKAKKDGRWDKAYESPANTTIPKDFEKKLIENQNAYKFWQTLNKTNTYAFVWRINNVKREEKRKKKIEEFVKMLSEGEKLH